MTDKTNIYEEREKIIQLWEGVNEGLQLGDECFDEDNWKEAIKSTYYFLVSKKNEQLIDKDDVDIFMLMKQFQVFPVFISSEFVAAQLITEALINTLMGCGLDGFGDDANPYGIFLCEGCNEDMLIYEINVEDIDLDEIVQGEDL